MFRLGLPRLCVLSSLTLSRYPARQLEQNRLANARVDRLCMSNYVGTAELKRKYHFGDSMSLVGDASREFSGGVIVKTTTIDQYCQDNHILPDGIKIDVEGGRSANELG